MWAQVTLLLLSVGLTTPSRLKSRLGSRAPDHQASLPSNINIVIDVPSYGLLAEEKWFDLDAGNSLELDKLKEKARDERETRQTQMNGMINQIEQSYGVQYKVAEEKSMLDTAHWDSQFHDKVKEILKDNPQPPAAVKDTHQSEAQ